MATEGEDNINMATGTEGSINIKMNGEESPVDVVSLVDQREISKEDCLKLVQSICKKLAVEGDEMMFMTVNLTQKTTTCVGSQLGVNFLNHKPRTSKGDHPDNPNISQMFQQFLEDHYEISNICDDKQIPFSPASSVIMESPSYTPFSSPRPYKAVKLPSSKSGKLLTPKIEVMESDFDGNSTATDSQEDDNQLSLESYVNSLPLTEQSFLIGSPKSPAIQQVITNQGVLARLLSPSGQGLPPFHRFQTPTIPNSSAVPVFQPPVIQNSTNFTGIRSPAIQNAAELLSTNQNEFPSPTSMNIRSVLARLLTPSRPPMNATQQISTSVPSFPTPTSFQSVKPQTTQNQSSSVPTPISLHPIQLQQVVNQSESANSFTPVQPPSESRSEKLSSGVKRGRGRPKGSFKRAEVPMESETDETENEAEKIDKKSDKTVTLRSGRRVRVPSWRKDILEESLKNNRKKMEEMTDIQIKQERISPTFPETPEDDQDEDVRVEFDFDILAELKKESDLEPDQSDDSSWCGTVHLTSGDDSTPSRVPFKFTFPGEKKQKLEEKENNTVKVDQNEEVEVSYDNTLSSLGLARKRARTINRCPDFTGKGHIWRCEDGRFNYYQMYTAQNISWGRQFTCKICKRVMQGNESLKTHCFTHEAFNKLHSVCQACDRIFDNHQALEDHIGEHEKLYSCHTCQVKFVSKLALIQHLNWVHKEMYSCPRCDKTFTSSKDLSNHLEECFDEKALVTRGGMKHLTEDWIGIKEDGKVTFKCRSCKHVFETVEEYNKHMLQHKAKFVQKLNEKLEKSMSTDKTSNEVSDDKSTTCELCNKIFETPIHLAKHRKNKHKKDQDDDEDTEEDVSADAYKCSSCNIHFDSAIAFSHHCTKYHPDNPMISLIDDTDFPCHLCSKRMRSKEGYDTHIKMHDNMMKKQCKMCGTFLHQEASIDLHCCIKEGSEFTCDKCSLSFYDHGFLAGHQHHVHGKPMEDIKVKDNVKGQPICNICGKTFKKVSDLEGHRSIHTGELPFVCHLCHKSFRLRSTLKTHLMTHRDFHEFMCEVCGRTFKLIESLRLHRRLHNKTCYFKCKHCPREFRAYDGLKYHMLQCHKDEVKGKKLKIYKCEHCNKDMATHQQYVRHVSIHTNEKPLQCDQCGTRWATISQLNAHKKKHNAENLKFACDVCNIKFPILSKLKRHVKTAKHIDNCRIKTLPIDTVHLEEEVGADPPHNNSRIIADVTDIEEKVEIMFYEINLPEDENSLGDETSMIYNISVVPDNQNGGLFQASTSNGVGTDLQVAATSSVEERSNSSSQLQQTAIDAITGSNSELQDAIGTITGNTNSENVQIQQAVVTAMMQAINTKNVNTSQVHKSVDVKSNINSNSVLEVSPAGASADTQVIDQVNKIGAVAEKLNAEVDEISAVTNSDKFDTNLQLTQSYDTTSDTENTDLISTEGSATEIDS